jgi:hypothetical protein
LSKNKKPVQQPIPGGLAAELRAYLEGRPAGKPVWPGKWPGKVADVLREDLVSAGIPYVVEKDGVPLYADFHSLRHSYITLLERLGASPKEAQALARHSDVNLTLARYTHKSLTELGAAVSGLTVLLSGSATAALPGHSGGLAAVPRADLEGAVGRLAVLASAHGATPEAIAVAMGIMASAPGPGLVTHPVTRFPRPVANADERLRTGEAHERVAG